MKKKNNKDIRLYDYTKLRFAVEIEVEFPNSKDSNKLIDRHKLLTGWEIDYDGSLDNGAEYRPKNSNHLHWNEEGLTQLKEILALIRVHRGRVSKNCGLHVHINCKKFTDKQIATIIHEFVHKQRFFIKKFNVHKDRVDSMCKLLPKENLQKVTQKIIHRFRNDDKGWGFSEYSYFDEKYYSLNASHLKKGEYGTLEFRLYNATLNYKKLKEQILFTLQFVRDCLERE